MKLWELEDKRCTLYSDGYCCSKCIHYNSCHDSEDFDFDDLNWQVLKVTKGVMKNG